MELNDKIYVAGHMGLVGSALVRNLRQQGYENLLLRTHAELDLTDQTATNAFFRTERPDVVIVAAGLVGGIQANAAAPADFFAVNMSIANHVILAAKEYGTKKLLYLGSACMYPKECPQPMKEEELLAGIPEVTNEGYALAKICGSRLCGYMRKQYGVDFISAIPANAYGAGDHFDLQKSHVIPALVMKYHCAKMEHQEQITLWGTGTALREFINTEDMADACVFLLNHYSDVRPINIGVGEEISIMGLAKLVKEVVGYEGAIVCDPTKPDGMMRRMVDSTKINQLGWHSKITLKDGITAVYQEYLSKLQGGLDNE